MGGSEDLKRVMAMRIERSDGYRKHFSCKILRMLELLEHDGMERGRGLGSP